MIRPRPTWVNRRNKVPWDTQSQAQAKLVEDFLTPIWAKGIIPTQIAGRDCPKPQAIHLTNPRIKNAISQ